MTSVFEEGQGVLWIGTVAGLDRLDRNSGGWKHYRHDPDDPLGLSSNSVEILLDWSLQTPEEPELLPALRGCCPRLAVIVLSGQPDAEQKTLEAGADAFVSKAHPPEKILATICAIG